jgi:hypothetical protein
MKSSSLNSVNGVTFLLVAMLALLGGAVSAQAQSGVVGTATPNQQATEQASPQVTPEQGSVAVAPDATAADEASAPKNGEAEAQQESTAEPGDSHVRIVRLSDVRGTVMMDRKTGQGMEATIQNMPIVEGVRVQTTAGDAEVEFEDGSTLRITPNTLIEFPQLVRRESGKTASTVKLVQGTMYVNLMNTKGNEFTVVTHEVISVTASTHLRVEMAGPKMTLGVFAGSAEVLVGSTTTVVGKKETLTLGGDVVQPVLAKNVATGPFDEWDKDEIKYHDQNSKGNALLGSSPGYGVSDLNYYGSFANVGGCGMMWQPYFVSAAWNPYGNGLWTWYPGAGYSWVSPYPWGWLPFHTGSWSFCPARGWGWVPGGSWNGLNNTVVVAHPINPNPGPPRPKPPMPPGPGKPTVLFASRAPMLTSKMVGQEGFVFRNNSAGLGVPRGSMGDLGKISPAVQQHGFVSRPAYADTGAGRGVAGAPVTLRPGSPNGGNEPNRGGNEPNRGGNEVNRGNGGEVSRGGGNYGGGNSGAGNSGAGSSHAPSGGYGGGAAPAPSSAPMGGGGGAAPNSGGAAGHTGK